ncbi:hypothetical protein D3C86_1091510 [compost metagenome]
MVLVVDAVVGQRKILCGTSYNITAVYGSIVAAGIAYKKLGSRKAHQIKLGDELQGFVYGLALL